MIAKRIIPCLDVRDGQVTKGVKFKGNVDIGDPVAMARAYYEDGADELVFYDITASSHNKDILIGVVSKVASEIYIPFSVGGGVRTIEDMRRVLLAGAEKISIDSSAVQNPSLIAQAARAFGSQCVVLSMQVKKTPDLSRGLSDSIPSGYEIYINGGRTAMGLDAIEWAKRGVELGAGELCVNSIDQDGTKKGYEIDLTRTIADAVSVPVIASGGAGNPRHIRDVFIEGHADAAIVASITHFGKCSIGEIKEYLKSEGILIRDKW